MRSERGASEGEERWPARSGRGGAGLRGFARAGRAGRKILQAPSGGRWSVGVSCGWDRATFPHWMAARTAAAGSVLFCFH